VQHSGRPWGEARRGRAVRRLAVGLALFSLFLPIWRSAAAVSATSYSHRQAPPRVALTAAPNWGLPSKARLPRPPQPSHCHRPVPRSGCVRHAVRLAPAAPNRSAAPAHRDGAGSTGAPGLVDPTPQNGLLSSAVIGGSPDTAFGSAVVRGPDGNMWLAGNQVIARVTPKGVETMFQATDAYGDGPADSNSSMVATAKDIWFLWNGSGGAGLGRVSMKGTVAFFAVPQAASEDLRSLSFVSGALWFTDAYGNLYRASVGGSGVGTVKQYPLVTVCGCSDSGFDLFQTGVINGVLYVAANVYPPSSATPSGALLKVTTSSPPTIVQEPLNITFGANGNGSSTEFVDNWWLGSITAGPGGSIWISDGIDDRIAVKGAGGTTGTITTGQRGDFLDGMVEAGGSMYVAASPIQTSASCADTFDRLSSGGSVQGRTTPGVSGWSPGLAGGPDGRIWYAATSNEPCTSGFPTVDAAKPAHGHLQVTPVAPQFLQPGGLVRAKNGSLYATSFDVGLAPNGLEDVYLASVVQVTPGFASTIYSTRPPSEWLDPAPGAVTQGPDGALWFLGADDDVYRFRNGSFTRYPIAGGLAGSPWGGQIVSGPRQSVWFAGTTGIDRLDMSGRLAIYPTESGGGECRGLQGGITTGSDGNIWADGNYTSACGSGGSDGGLIFRMTPTGRILHTYKTAQRFAGPMTSEPLGRVWAVGTTGQSALPGTVDSLLSIRPGDRVPVLTRLDGSITCQSLVTGPDGNLWCSGQDTSTGIPGAGATWRITPGGNLLGLTVGGPALAFDNANDLWTTGAVQILGGSYPNYLVTADRVNLGSSEPGPAEQAGIPSPIEFPTACHTGLPVNCLTGEFSHFFDDLEVPGLGGGLSFGHSYSSFNHGTNGPLGYGWSHTYDAALSIHPSSGAVTIHMPMGASFTFTPSGGGYTAPARVLARLAATSGNTLTLTDRTNTAYVFNRGSGRLVRVVDHNGYATSLSYAHGRLRTVTDPMGRSLHLAYAGSHLTTVVDPGGRTCRFAYTHGNLTTVTEPNGGVWRFTYDGSHRLLSMKNPLDGTTTNTYDSSGRVEKQTDPAGGVTSFTYGTDQTTVTDPRGLKTINRYFTGMLVSTTNAAGTKEAKTWTYTHDPATLQITSTASPSGRTTQATFDMRGDELSSVDGGGHTTTYTYDSRGDITSISRPGGETIVYTYDREGNELTMTELAGRKGPRAVTRLSYDRSHPGEIVKRTAPDGGVWTFAYDRYGDRTVAVDPDGGKTVDAYNVIGELTSEIRPDGEGKAMKPALYRTTYGYDADGNVTRVEDPLHRVVVSRYDLMDHLVASVDPLGHTTTYVYSPLGQLESIVRPGGATVRWGHDADGNTVSLTDGDGHTWRYTYNNLNQPESIVDPLKRRTAYTYTSDGQVATRRDGDGRLTSYAYLADGSVSTITYAGDAGRDVRFHYDAAGRRTRVTIGASNSTYRYDGFGHLTSETNPAGITVRYAYDLDGNTTRLTYPYGHVVAFTYDGADRLVRLKDWLGHTTGFGYDPDGMLKSERLAGGLAITRTYDRGDALSAILAGSIFRISISRRRDGLISGVKQSGLPGAGETSYGYSLDDRLTSAGSHRYGYDAAGNLTAIGKIRLRYGKADELRAMGSATFTYDAAGNRISATHGTTSTRFGYDGEQRLIRAHKASLSYDVDGDVIALKSGKGTAKNAYDSLNTLPLRIVSGPDSLIYGPDALPVERIRSGHAVYLGTDWLNSVRAEISPKAALKGAVSYDPYGSVVHHKGSFGSPLGFTGAPVDAGVPDLGARHLDPATGAFLTSDPLLQVTGQPYAYARDDPVNQIDPSGLAASLSTSPTVPSLICDYIARATQDSSTLLGTGLNVGCAGNGVAGAFGSSTPSSSAGQANPPVLQKIAPTLNSQALVEIAKYLGPEDAVPALAAGFAYYDAFSLQLQLQDILVAGVLEYLFPQTGPEPPPPPPPIVTCSYGGDPLQSYGRYLSQLHL